MVQDDIARRYIHNAYLWEQSGPLVATYDWFYDLGSGGPYVVGNDKGITNIFPDKVSWSVGGVDLNQNPCTEDFNSKKKQIQQQTTQAPKTESKGVQSMKTWNEFKKEARDLIDRNTKRSS